MSFGLERKNVIQMQDDNHEIPTLLVGFVGCEKEDIQFSNNLEDLKWSQLEKGFQRILLRMKATDVYVNMQRTSELVFARAAIHLKEQGESIRIHCCLPYRGFSIPFNKQEKSLLMECIFKGDETIVINEGDFRPYFRQVSDEYIVNECQYLLVAGSLASKEILDIVEYALYAKHPVFVLDPMCPKKGWVKEKFETTKKTKKEKEHNPIEERLF